MSSQVGVFVVFFGPTPHRLQLNHLLHVDKLIVALAVVRPFEHFAADLAREAVVRWPVHAGQVSAKVVAGFESFAAHGAGV